MNNKSCSTWHGLDGPLVLRVLFMKEKDEMKMRRRSFEFGFSLKDRSQKSNKQFLEFLHGKTQFPGLGHLSGTKNEKYEGRLLYAFRACFGAEDRLPPVSHPLAISH